MGTQPCRPRRLQTFLSELFTELQFLIFLPRFSTLSTRIANFFSRGFSIDTRRSIFLLLRENDVLLLLLFDPIYIDKDFVFDCVERFRFDAARII